MLIRYNNEGGAPKAVARIYTRKEHGLDPSKIDPDAVRAIARLKDSGFEAYIVGGAVRDIILGLVPHDFDIATDASPRQLRRLFRQARTIGRRFRLVHLVYKDKVIEVSTFRCEGAQEEGEDANNVFGSAETDAKRRDFTINSLYYDPVDNKLVDFNNSLEDYRKRRIRSVIPLSRTFKDDPVRMIRAVKYSVTTGFALELPLRRAIKRDSALLEGVSVSRLTEEVAKILSSGHSAGIISELDRLNLLSHLMPSLCLYTGYPSFLESLRTLDQEVASSVSHGGKEPDPEKSEQVFRLTEPLITAPIAQLPPLEHLQEVYRQIKVLVSPITPPNSVVETASRMYLRANGYPVPKRSHPAVPPSPAARAPRRRRSRKPAGRLPEALRSSD